MKLLQIAGGIVTVGALWGMLKNRPANERSSRVTKLSETLAPEIIRDAFIRLEGYAPMNATVAMLSAHSALETGRWQKMRGNNFGNVIETRSDHDYFCLNKRKWRWYSTPEQGAYDWLALLRKRYPEAWREALMGDSPAAFVKALKANGYFEEDEQPYALAVGGLFAEYLGQLEPGSVHYSKAGV